MPGATAGGLPYPLGTEPVRDGDNAIMNLADALQARGHGLQVQAGRFTGTLTGSSYALVTFPVPFKAGTVPVMVGWFGWGQGAGDGLVAMFENVSLGWAESGFHVLARLASTGAGPGAAAVDLQWIAIGAKA